MFQQIANIIRLSGKTQSELRINQKVDKNFNLQSVDANTAYNIFQN